MQYPVGERPHPHFAFGFSVMVGLLLRNHVQLISCASGGVSKLEQLNVPLGHIQKQYLSLSVAVVTLIMAGKDTFRGYLMGLGFQGRVSVLGPTPPPSKHLDRHPHFSPKAPSSKPRQAILITKSDLGPPVGCLGWPCVVDN